MQMLTIAGTIGRDAEVRHTQGGEPVANFSVAVDNGKDSNGNRRDATWFDAALWGKRATGLAPYLLKGGKVTITGRPTAREHNGKVYLGVNVDQITLQGGGQQRQEPDSRDMGGAPAGGGFDDQIPFMREWRG